MKLQSKQASISMDGRGTTGAEFCEGFGPDKHRFVCDCVHARVCLYLCVVPLLFFIVYFFYFDLNLTSFAEDGKNAQSMRPLLKSARISHTWKSEPRCLRHSIYPRCSALEPLHFYFHGHTIPHRRPVQNVCGTFLLMRVVALLFHLKERTT